MFDVMVGWFYIVDVFVVCGIVCDCMEVFDGILYLWEGYYEFYYVLDLFIVVCLIIDVGGVVIIVYFVMSGWDSMMFELYIECLIEVGFGGFEIDYWENIEVGKCEL